MSDPVPAAAAAPLPCIVPTSCAAPVVATVRTVADSGALFRFAVALILIVAAVAIPLTHWPALGVLGCVAVGLCAAAGIEARTLLRRLLLFVPFTTLIALGIPVSQGFRDGWDTAAGIVVRGTISLLVGLWLAKAVPVERLLRSLERIGCPAVLTTLAAFMLRYVFVLHEEAGRMRNARAARSFGPLGAARRAQLVAQLVGMLLIRTMDRADRVHRAMCARGWDGRLRRLDD